MNKVDVEQILNRQLAYLRQLCCETSLLLESSVSTPQDRSLHEHSVDPAALLTRLILEHIAAFFFSTPPGVLEVWHRSRLRARHLAMVGLSDPNMHSLSSISKSSNLMRNTVLLSLGSCL